MKKDIEATENFTVFKEYLESVIDLKQYIAFEVNKLKSGHSDDIIKHLTEENKFLENEIRETRQLVSVILENITRQNQSHVTNSCNLQGENNFENGWHKSPKRGTFKTKAVSTHSSALDCFKSL